GPRPPWTTPRRQRPWLLLGAAAVVALIVVAGVAVWLLRPSRQTPAVPGANSTASVPAPSEAETLTRLLSLLPRRYPPGACKPITPPTDALAEASCDKNADPDGPPSATYALYPDAVSLHGAFNRISSGSNVIECPGRIQSPGPWHRNATPDKTSGML